MRKTKIFHGNQYVTSFVCDGKKYTKLQLYAFLATRMMKKCIQVAAIFVCAGWVFTGGVYFAKASIAPQTLLAKEVVEAPVKFDNIPMLVKICKAESGGRQFNKNGDVLRGTVDKSDIGYCQINERYNNDEARKLGYDIYTEDGNKAFALHLFLNKGTQPWLASMCTAHGWGTKSECNR